MVSSRLGPLEKMAKSLKLNMSNDKLASLSRALELFSLEANRLEGAYNSLKDEFTLIYQELEATNKKLIRKIAELDVMTFYFESILSNISQGILFIDLNGDITTYNSAAKKILGFEENHVLHHPFWKNFEDHFFGFSMREALATRNPPQVSQTHFMNLEGENREIEVNASFVKEEGQSEDNYSAEVPLKKLEGMIIIIRDITQILALQLLANRNDRMKELGEMAAMVAHEIRNPLGGIKGFASLLKRDLKDHPAQAEMAGYIISGTDALNQLVTNVLNYSRPVTPEIEIIDLVPLIDELRKYFEADHQSKKSKMMVQHEDSKLEALADPNLLKLAILNLLVNASDAMNGAGDILVCLSKTKVYAVIEITDQGCGIPEHHLEKIFMPFFTTKIEGNGFGLSEVHKVIQAHHGHIGVKSEVDKGTTFTIEIPLKKKHVHSKNKVANEVRDVD